MAVSPQAMLLPLVLAETVFQLRRLEHERGDQRHRHRSRHDRSGVQIAITVFTLTMAALMIPGSKLSDI